MLIYENRLAPSQSTEDQIWSRIRTKLKVSTKMFGVAYSRHHGT